MGSGKICVALSFVKSGESERFSFMGISFLTNY